MTARPSSNPPSNEAADAGAAPRKASGGADGNPNDRVEQWEERLFDTDTGSSVRGDDCPKP